jgi:hypothetical protein
MTELPVAWCSPAIEAYRRCFTDKLLGLSTLSNRIHGDVQQFLCRGVLLSASQDTRLFAPLSVGLFTFKIFQLADTYSLYAVEAASDQMI